jgi:hypothetical protein
MTKQIVWLMLYDYISSPLAMCKGNDIFFFLIEKFFLYLQQNEITTQP